MGLHPYMVIIPFMFATRLLGTKFTSTTFFMPFHFKEAPANVLTNPALDPVAKIPELKVCAVRIEKVAAGTAEEGAV